MSRQLCLTLGAVHDILQTRRNIDIFQRLLIYTLFGLMVSTLRSTFDLCDIGFCSGYELQSINQPSYLTWLTCSKVFLLIIIAMFFLFFVTVVLVFLSIILIPNTSHVLLSWSRTFWNKISVFAIKTVSSAYLQIHSAYLQISKVEKSILLLIVTFL